MKQPFELFGTVTSPFVRRVRIVAAELDVPYTLVDTSTDAGQAALRASTPIWKVPTARFGGQVVLDSHVIVETLLRRWGPGEIEVPADDDLEQRNVATVIDGALDASINAFYLRKDGVTPANVPYVKKQLDRVAVALAWLDERAASFNGWRLHLRDVALLTALDWMRFRKAYDVEQHPGLCRSVARHADRASVRATLP